jgi:hypothetical protein
MSAQTTYSRYHTAAYSGQLQGDGPKVIDTYVVETAAGIAPGVVVSKGTADDQCVVGGDGTGIGVVVRNLDVENNTSDEIVYAQGTPVGVLVEGDISVLMDGAGDKGSAIYYDDTTGAIGAGAAASGATALNGVLAETIAAVGVARVRLSRQGS